MPVPGLNKISRQRFGQIENRLFFREKLEELNLFPPEEKAEDN